MTIAVPERTAQDPPETTIRASIVIVNYNGGELLQRCVAAVLSDCSPNDEIILVDNKSTDGSAQDIQHNFPTVQVILSQENLGFGAGNNLGVQHAKGHYLALLNPDTIVEPGWLDALIEAFDVDPQVGLVTPKILLLNDPETINTCGHNVHYTGLALCRGMGKHRSMLTQQAEVSGVSGAACVMRRRLFEELGGFDTNFFLYMEDVDLSWRVRLAGYRCLYVPSSVIYHRYTLRFRYDKTLHQERNRYLMLLKGLQWRTMAAILPALLLAEVVTWGFVLLRDRKNWVNKLWAYTAIFLHWDNIMRRRQHVQSTRKISDYDLIAGSSYQVEFEQTGKSLAVRMAHLVCDPLFLGFQRLALVFIRW